MTSFAGEIGGSRRERPIDAVPRRDCLTATMFNDTADTLHALRVAFASSLSGVAVCDRFGQILLVNDAMALAFGYTQDETLERHLGELVPDLESRGWRDGVLEVDGVRKDGSHAPIKVSLATIQGRQPLLVASVIDLADQRRLEARAATTTRLETFQALMSSLATRLAASRSGIDSILDDVISEVGDALVVDRCVAFLSADTDGSPATVACAWARTGCALPERDFDALKALPWTMAKARAGQAVCAATLDELANAMDRETMNRLGAGSCAAVPLRVNDRRGAMIVDVRVAQPWPRDVIDRLTLFAAILAQALARKGALAGLDVSGTSPSPPDDQASRDVVPWRKSRSGDADGAIASDSAAIKGVLAQVHQVAPTGATVLLLGETGVGKEVFAQAIHELSPRHRREMIRVSCAAIPVALIESELFGRERGAFTGALSRQIGRFEAANGATIFLDEIGELPLDMQVKLLRVLQQRTIERLGANQSIKIDVRVIAATNKNLEDALADRTFREDLYYRINVFPITIPPLRERTDDIPSLVWTFVDEFSQAFDKKISSISKASLAALQRYPWPGNVRELRNVIERAMIVSTGPTLVVDPPGRAASPGRANLKLVDIEAAHIVSVLDSCGWRIRGAGGAAERLGLKPTTLESRMAVMGIAREQRSRAV